MVLYQPNENAALGVLTLGYRPFDSTISVGPFVGVTSRGGGVRGGILATIEVSR
jgi:hypothetical protein